MNAKAKAIRHLYMMGHIDRAGVIKAYEAGVITAEEAALILGTDE